MVGGGTADPHPSHSRYTMRLAQWLMLAAACLAYLVVIVAALADR